MKQTLFFSLISFFLVPTMSFAFLEGECQSVQQGDNEWQINIGIWNDFPRSRSRNRRLEVRMEPPEDSQQSFEKSYFVQILPSGGRPYELRFWGIPRLTVDTFPDPVRRLLPYRMYRSRLSLSEGPGNPEQIDTLSCQFFPF